MVFLQKYMVIIKMAAIVYELKQALDITVCKNRKKCKLFSYPNTLKLKYNDVNVQELGQALQITIQIRLIPIMSN